MLNVILMTLDHDKIESFNSFVYLSKKLKNILLLRVYESLQILFGTIHRRTMNTTITLFSKLCRFSTPFFKKKLSKLQNFDIQGSSNDTNFFKPIVSKFIFSKLLQWYTCIIEREIKKTEIFYCHSYYNSIVKQFK